MATATFSQQLEDWLKHDKNKTLGELNQIFGQKTFALIFLLMMAIPATPLATGGITHVILLPVTFIAAAQMVIGRRELWLPEKFKNFSVGGKNFTKAIKFIIKYMRKAEKHSRPRLSNWFNINITRSIIGLFIIAFAAGAFVAPIFSGLDTLPSLGGVLIALAMLFEDIAIAIIGLVVGLVGLGLIVFVGQAITHFVQQLF